MSSFVFGTARTVWVGNLETGQYPNGNPSKRILFRIVVNRRYPSTVTLPDGSTGKDYKADYYLCEARDQVAELIAKYASARDSNGKLMSRLIEYFGNEETYTTTKQYDFKDANGNPTSLNVENEHENIYKIKEIGFLDKNPAPNNNSSNVTVNGTVQGGTSFTVDARSATKPQNTGQQGNVSMNPPMNPPVMQPQQPVAQQNPVQNPVPQQSQQVYQATAAQNPVMPEPPVVNKDFSDLGAGTPF